MPKEPLTHRVGYLLTLGIIAKLMVDTTVQIFNPFLTIIAAGLGIGVVKMGKIVALRSLMGLSAPVFGTMADRIGYRSVMRISLLMGGAGMMIAAVFPNVFTFTIAMILAGAGQSGYTPTLHAYLSSKLPYEKRARGIGIVEYSWALAGIVGLFATGYLIEALSWRAPFFILGGIMVLMSFVYLTLPKGQQRAGQADSTPKTGFSPGRIFRRIQAFLDLGPNARSAWGTIIINGLNFFAMMHVMIIHGGWLQREYGLGPAKLGNVALLFGFCDLIASVIVSIAVDRIGKRRSVMIGVAGVVVGYALMPFLNRSITLALVSLSIPRAFFEFATVSNFPLISEQVPKQRGKVLSLSITFGLIGSTIASATGPAAYVRFGVWGLAPVGLAAAAVSLLILIFIIKEQPKHRV
jgi:predicted MFS family arabinose efflux permease